MQNTKRGERERGGSVELSNFCRKNVDRPPIFSFLSLNECVAKQERKERDQREREEGKKLVRVTRIKF